MLEKEMKFVKNRQNREGVFSYRYVDRMENGVCLRERRIDF
jgi:hypothetical protein